VDPLRAVLRRIVACVATLLVLVAVLPAAAQQFTVPPLARVVDQANVLSPATREQLTRLLAEHERRNSNQIVVVTLATLGDLDIAEAGLRLGREWKLGTKQHSNGVLLIVAPAERKLRIEVGYGLEGDLPDGRAFQIINTEIVPRLRAGDIEGGILKGTMAVIAAVEGTYQPPQTTPAQSGIELGPAVFVLVLAMVVIIALYNNGGFGGGGPGGGRMSRYGRRSAGWGTGPVVLMPPMMGGRGGRSGGGGWSGGGGSFGGGGASGSW
jgi:uncharacterized protein